MTLIGSRLLLVMLSSLLVLMHSIRPLGMLLLLWQLPCLVLLRQRVGGISMCIATRRFWSCSATVLYNSAVQHHRLLRWGLRGGVLLGLLGLCHGGRGTDDNARDRLHAAVWVHNLSCSTKVGSLQTRSGLSKELGNPV